MPESASDELVRHLAPGLVRVVELLNDLGALPSADGKDPAAESGQSCGVSLGPTLQNFFSGHGCSAMARSG